MGGRGKAGWGALFGREEAYVAEAGGDHEFEFVLAGEEIGEGEEGTVEHRLGFGNASGPAEFRNGAAVAVIFDRLEGMEGGEEDGKAGGPGRGDADAAMRDGDGGALSIDKARHLDLDFVAGDGTEFLRGGGAEDAFAGSRDGGTVLEDEGVSGAGGEEVEVDEGILVDDPCFHAGGDLPGHRCDEGDLRALLEFVEPGALEDLAGARTDFAVPGVLDEAVAHRFHDAVLQSEENHERRDDRGEGEEEAGVEDLLVEQVGGGEGEDESPPRGGRVVAVRCGPAGFRSGLAGWIHGRWN